MHALKLAGVSIHAICTGAGAGPQGELWRVPGASAYLSGASFPYAKEETADLLGFEPEHYVSAEMAVDLASAAYMRAYRFGGAKPIGLGLTAAVATSRARRGSNRSFACVVSDGQSWLLETDLGTRADARTREHQGHAAEADALELLQAVARGGAMPVGASDETSLLRERFFARPYFTLDGRRLAASEARPAALMPGAYNRALTYPPTITA